MVTQAILERETWSHGGKTISCYVSRNLDRCSENIFYSANVYSSSPTIIRYANLQLQDGTVSTDNDQDLL